MKFSIFDLHCDLLLFLAKNEARSIFQSEARCSVPQLQSGGVRFQTLALFAMTKPDSAEWGRKQIAALKKIQAPFKESGITIRPAIENGSILVEEEEPLSLAFERFTHYEKEVGPFLYISLTWNGENRFGGGNGATVGLKKDGEALLEFLSGKKIAIDFSHTSDQLAWDILNYIDKKKLSLMPIASHSNFRAIANNPRNLPDALAQEIFRRKGVIGLNFIRAFTNADFEKTFFHMVEHGIKLGGEEHLGLGADFFCDEDVGVESAHLKPFFHAGFDNASCYPRVLQTLSTHFSEKFLCNLSSGNCKKFFET